MVCNILNKVHIQIVWNQFDGSEKERKQKEFEFQNLFGTEFQQQVKVPLGQQLVILLIFRLLKKWSQPPR